MSNWEKIKESVEGALTRSKQIETIEVETLKNGFRYTAIYNDGSREVIRKKATKLYENAFLYSGMVCSGKMDLGAIFTFGKNPTQLRFEGYCSTKLVRIFKL